MGRFYVRSSLCVVLVVAVMPGAPAPAWCAGKPVINEVYYDHPGSDTGYEFVEIYNSGPSPAVLDGVTLEFHNGSGEGWSVLWTGGVLDTVPPLGVFTVGAALVDPPPDAVIGLSLQNGPDAVALFAGGVAVDVVGYGGLDDERYVETAGAARVPAGRSIARVPDGHDTGDNAADFVAADPTPGRTNVPRHDAVLSLAPGVDARAVVDVAPATVGFDVTNGGTEDIGAGEVSVSVLDSSATGESHLTTWGNAAAIAPGSLEAFAVPVPSTEGYHWIRAWLAYAPDERTAADSLSVLRRVGTPPVLVSEVLSRPPDGVEQFVEVYNAGDDAVDLGGWGLRDRSHDPVVVAPPGAVLPGRAFAVFTPDPGALCTAFGCGGLVFPVDATWPTINRGGGEVADSVVVVDAYGLAVDAVGVPGMPSAAGNRSLERVGLYRGSAGVVWVLSQDPRGASPGRPGRRVLYAPPPPGRIDVAPNPYFPAEGVLAVSVDAPEGARAVVTVFDPWGRRVAGVGVADDFPTVLVWNGRDATGRRVLPGLYIIACEIRAASGAHVEKVVVACGRR